MPQRCVLSGTFTVCAFLLEGNTALCGLYRDGADRGADGVRISLFTFVSTLSHQCPFFYRASYNTGVLYKYVADDSYLSCALEQKLTVSSTMLCKSLHGDLGTSLSVTIGV